MNAPEEFVTPAEPLADSIAADVAARVNAEVDAIESAPGDRPDPALARLIERVRAAANDGTPLAISGHGSKAFLGGAIVGERLDTSEKLATLWKTAYGDSVLPGPEAARGA